MLTLGARKIFNVLYTIYHRKTIGLNFVILTAYVLVVLPAFGMRYWYAMTTLFMTGMPSTVVE